MAKTKQISGGARLKLNGKRAVLLGLQPGQYEQISQAAKLDCRPITQFVTNSALIAAKKIIGKGY